MGERRCSRCGNPEPAWLIAGPYNGDSGPGRLLIYCDRCRDEYRFRTTAVPVSWLDLDPDRVLELMYLTGVTQSDPDIAASVLGVPFGRWVVTARAVLARPLGEDAAADE